METGPSTGTTGHPASPPLDRTGDKAGQRGQPSCDATGGAALGARLLADHLGLHRHKAHKADGGQLSPRNNFELRRTFPIRRFCERQDREWLQHKNKKRLAKNRKPLRVEAAGIEPASRGISMKASTRVVDCLSLAPPDANRQAAGETVRERVLTASVPDVTRGDPELAAGSRTSPEKVLSRGYLLLGSQDKVVLGK